jgi:hypothetical protein
MNNIKGNYWTVLRRYWIKSWSVFLHIDSVTLWHTMYKTKVVIPSTQTDNLPQHNCFCVNVLYVLNRKVWYIINCAQNWNWIIMNFTHDLQDILNYMVFDMFTKYFVYVTQQLTFASYDYNKVLKIWWVWIELTGDSLLNSRLYRHFEYCLHEIFISWLHNYLWLQS